MIPHQISKHQPLIVITPEKSQNLQEFLRIIRMALGVLEHTAGAGHHVPGTVFLDSHTNTAELELSGLKKGSGKNSEVILVPQPSNDPNDPLNWPLWQRDCVLLLYCFCTVCVTGGSVSTILFSMLQHLM